MSSYSLSNDLIINFGSRYDLTSSQTSEIDFGLGFSLGSWEYKINQEYLNEEKEKLNFSVIYDDECTRLTFSFENRYQDVGASTPVRSLIFRVQLKPFGKVVFSQGGDQVTF